MKYNTSKKMSRTCKKGNCKEYVLMEGVCVTIFVDGLMNEGYGTRGHIAGKIHRRRHGFLTHFQVVLHVSIQEPVGVSSQSLLSQALLHLPWSHPHRIPHPPCTFNKQSNHKHHRNPHHQLHRFLHDYEKYRNNFTSKKKRE